jgi:hypothetical protein
LVKPFEDMVRIGKLLYTPWSRTGGVEVDVQLFLILALDGGKWSAAPGETASGTHWIGGWAGPRAGLDNLEKR